MEMKDKLLFIRAKMNMSQESLARVLGVSFATINRWERGHTIPSPRYQVAIDNFCKENGITFNGVKNEI